MIARGSKGRKRSDKAALDAISTAVAEHTKDGHMAPFIPEGEALTARWRSPSRRGDGDGACRSP